MTGSVQRAPRAFFGVDPRILARRLIGQRLVRRLNDGTRLSGLIVETEAYCGPADRAAHSFGGHRSERNESMYGEPGTAYVYFTYGMHHCVNVVCGRGGHPVAVLLRALGPVEGIDAMRAHRERGKPLRDRDLCSGPGKLCEALAIDRDLDGEDLVSGRRIWIERVRARAYPASALTNAARVGVESAGDWAGKPLRWCLTASEHVSRKAMGSGE